MFSSTRPVSGLRRRGRFPSSLADSVVVAWTDRMRRQRFGSGDGAVSSRNDGGVRVIGNEAYFNGSIQGSE
jgi:hypothetical protein